MDPIADMLTRIRNAAALGRREVRVPHSKLKANIAQILTAHGYLGAVREEVDSPSPEATTEEPGETSTKTQFARKWLILELAYRGESPAIRSIRRVSTPGLRIYRGVDELPRPRGGFGLLIVSTPKGLMTDREARRARIGGEVVCEVIS
ncbi:30S ribosomal protein S8 [Candidatus Berkelbacteria bacterium]|nr:30S ribosomal protein S8 [Candidatus Berkelbacteria bacterium]